MNYLTLIAKNLGYYWKRNLALAMGVAVCAAVITGALMVGDSVRHNLDKGVELRLGAVTHTVQAGDRFFTSQLAAKMGQELHLPVAPVMLLQGVAVNDGGEQRVNHIQVVGVDPTFDQTLNVHRSFGTLTDDEVIISQNLATRLNVKTGDEILLRIRKASLIPLNTPFVSDESNTVPSRYKVKGIAGAAAMGRFNLRISQTAPFNAFVSLRQLNSLMGLQEHANAFLLSDPAIKTERIEQAIQKCWSLADLNLSLKRLPASNEVQINSERVFIEPAIAEAIDKINNTKRHIITYFVNSFTAKNDTTPYSFVSTLPNRMLADREIIINRWLAEDLKARVGDPIELKYFVVGPLRELTEKSASFRVRSIVEIQGGYADKDLIPNLPGMTDAGNCRDWNTGVPIDLKKIRKKDEAYWKAWRGTPKAFISDAAAEALWKNRFGTFTAIRMATPSQPVENVQGSPNGATDPSSGAIATDLLKTISPASVGFHIDPVRESGTTAASQGVDFSQLFSSLSFFILVSGVVLMVLLFLLNLESRKEQLTTLTFLGIPLRKVRKIILAEELVITVAGALLGLLLAYGYSYLVFRALNGVWQDAVRTGSMELFFTFSSIVTGLLISVAAAGVTVYISTNRYLKQMSRLEKKSPVTNPRKIQIRKLIVMLSGVGALALIALQIVHRQAIDPNSFFIAGGLILISLLVAADLAFITIRNVQSTVSGASTLLSFDLKTLCFKNAIRNKNRSLNIVILFAIGTFIVISTGANRQDLFADASNRSGGTGGFLTLAESTVPIAKDLNNPEVREAYGLEGTYPIVQLMSHEGDDASCLNLNRVTNPSILGVKPELLKGRFTFSSSTPLLNPREPWSSLNQPLPGGVIPAIADETVIKWGLGLAVGDTIVYTNEMGQKMKLKLIGGLANSIFQGHVIIAQNYFQANFPSGSGTSFFLIDSPKDKEGEVEEELKQTFRDEGWEIVPAAQKLAEFNSIENTYLSIFLVMGALGLLIGTVGLGVILVRSILERRSEIALLKAVGFNKPLIFRLFFAEYTALLVTGILIGVVSSTVSIFPSLVSVHSDVSFSTVAVILTLLFACGIFWITLLTSRFIRLDQINEALRNE